MKSILLASVMVFALASTAHAQGGVNLSWNDCGTFGIVNSNFACNTNTGFHRIYGSFIPPADLTQLLEVDATFDVVCDQLALSSWWDLPATGGCRSGALGALSDFTAGPFSCADPWSGLSSTFQVYDYHFGGANHARLRTVTALPPTEPTTVASDVEYYAIQINISNAKSTGTGSCAGCAIPTCVTLQSLNLIQTQGNPSYLVTNPLVQQWVTFNGVVAACLPTPVRNSTWGSVKALYR